MGRKSRFAQSYSTQLIPFIQRHALYREARRGTSRPAGRTVTNSALTRQFAARQRQCFIDGFRNDARLLIRLLAAAAGRLGRVFLIFSHSVFLQSVLELAAREAISFSEVAWNTVAACSMWRALMGAVTPASRAFCSASSQARS